jgi:xanthine dehydrogenase small subunit
MRDKLLIYVNGMRHDVVGANAFGSLSDFLRYELCLTGTKVVCAEGDCGSCTVFIGRAAGDRIVYKPITSCIQFLHQLDCAHIITIEGLTPATGLNPIQQSMVRCHGAQCGFCTPGVVVSLYSAFEDSAFQAGTAICESDLRSALVGNLCRCTGYQSIIRAGLETPAQEIQSLDSLYPPQEMRAAFAAHSSEAVMIRHAHRCHFKPVSISDAIAFKSANPDCTLIAGATDIGVLINKGIRDPKVILNLSGMPGLCAIASSPTSITAGATATIAELERIAEEALPEFARFLHWFGSPPIKNAATIGGNIANGSPIGDSMPALFVLDAEVELTGTAGTRRVNINQFYTGYRKTVMTPDELITAVHIPLPTCDEHFKLYKISRRKNLDISAFSAAIRMRLTAGKIVDCRIASGGVAATIIRLSPVEKFLVGKEFDEITIRAAADIARDEVRPISDVRGSADYRSQLAGNILLKFFAEISHEAAPALSHNGSASHNGNGVNGVEKSRTRNLDGEI